MTFRKEVIIMNIVKRQCKFIILPLFLFLIVFIIDIQGFQVKVKAQASTIETDYEITENNSETDKTLLHLTEVNKPDLLNLYTEKKFDIFSALYNMTSVRGIFSMEQTIEKTPICYDILELEYFDTYTLYAWKNSKWSKVKSKVSDKYALRVLTWSNNKWNEKIYRFTDSKNSINPLKSNKALSIKQDKKGDFYFSIEKDGDYYIIQTDKTLKVKYKVNVSALTNSSYIQFYVLSNNNVILETYESTSDKGYDSEALREYNNLKLLNLKEGKIDKEYETAYVPFGYINIEDHYIYFRDKSKENIVKLNSRTGEVEKVIHLADYDYLMEAHKYSYELGSQYEYDYAVCGKYIYLLKKSGIYKIDTHNGKFRKIMDNTYSPFPIQDMRFLDILVKDDTSIYIMAVYFDAECASILYTYTR